MSNVIFHKTEEYSLSYLPYPSDTCRAMDTLICDIRGKGHEGIGRSETAICITNPDKFLILYGDHREAMEPIKDDLDALKQYWIANKELHSHTTEYLEDEE